MGLDDYFVQVVVFEEGHGGQEGVLLGRFGLWIFWADVALGEFFSPVGHRLAWGIDDVFESIHRWDRTADEDRGAQRRVLREQRGLYGAVAVGS